MTVTIGPFPAYLQGRLPPLFKRRTRNTRRHKLGLWTTPRCGPGSEAWFKAARAAGECADKGGDEAATQSSTKDCADIDSSISVPVQVYIVF